MLELSVNLVKEKQRKTKKNYIRERKISFTGSITLAIVPDKANCFRVGRYGSRRACSERINKIKQRVDIAHASMIDS